MGCHIQVKNLALTYSWSSFKKNIFKDLNLCIETGSFVTITGSNGIGKSSLVKLILGLAKPDAGEIILNNETVRAGYPDAVRAKKAAFLSQHIEDWFFSESVSDELMYGRDDTLNSTIMDMLEQHDLMYILNRSIEVLSGGERQGLALVQFMLNQAPLLILDEPSSFLDHPRASSLQDYLKQAYSEGKTIIHVTQYPSEVAWGSHHINLDDDDMRVKAL